MKDLDDYEHKIFVRYEDLVEQPESLLKQITAAVDLEFDPDMVPRAHHTLPLGSGERHKWFPIRPDTNERYLEQLDVTGAKIIEEQVGPVASQMGYRSPFQ